jgi:hypothetical protein
MIQCNSLTRNIAFDAEKRLKLIVDHLLRLLPAYPNNVFDDLLFVEQEVERLASAASLCG